MTIVTSLCHTWSKPIKTGFLGWYSHLCHEVILHEWFAQVYVKACFFLQPHEAFNLISMNVHLILNFSDRQVTMLKMLLEKQFNLGHMFDIQLAPFVRSHPTVLFVLHS